MKGGSNIRYILLCFIFISCIFLLWLSLSTESFTNSPSGETNKNDGDVDVVANSSKTSPVKTTIPPDAKSFPTILNPSVNAEQCIGKYCWKTTASAYNQTATIPESIGKYGYIHNYDVLPDSKPTLEKHDASHNPLLDLPGPFSGNFLLGSEAKPY